MHKKIRIFLMTPLVLFGCSDEGDLSEDFTASSQALKTCSIVLGGGGKSQTITQSFSGTTGSYTVNTSSAWDFIRSTSGECQFTIYNDSNQSGRYVTLGTDLSVRIRAGEDGIRYKDDGGGATWRVRSVKIEPVSSTSCFLNIGGGGVRMNYYPGNYNQVPAMDRISYFFGGNCDAKAWNDVLFGANDSDNRYVALHTNAVNITQSNERTVYDPGFRIRSISIRNWYSSNCTNETTLNRDYGRCLPFVKLPSSIYATSDNNDKDRDGLIDEMENALADAFTALVFNNSSEDATRPYTTADIQSNSINSYPYYDYLGNPVIEPVVVFQVRKAGNTPNRIEVAYMQIWKEDTYNTTLCGGHHGDTQADVFTLETPPVNNVLHGKFWWLKSTQGMKANEANASSHALTDPLKFNSSNLANSAEDYTATPVDNSLFHIGCDEACISAQEDLERLELSQLEHPFNYNNDDDLKAYQTHEDMPLSVKDADTPTFIAINQFNSGIAPLIDDSQNADTQSEMNWKQGDTHLRAPLFERFSSDPSNTNRHMAYYYSKGKHHEYIDGKFGGQPDKKTGCSSITVHTNGRGYTHSPAYPQRLWNLKAPIGKGDAYKFNNVGSRDYFKGFVNNLTAFGFPNMRVWRDACFYSDETSSANKAFLCSNNLNKQCCLQTNPNCSKPSNDANWCCAKSYDSTYCKSSKYSDVPNASLYNKPNGFPYDISED